VARIEEAKDRVRPALTEKIFSQNELKQERSKREDHAQMHYIWRGIIPEKTDETISKKQIYN
jgi:hypothetical protein